MSHGVRTDRTTQSLLMPHAGHLIAGGSRSAFVFPSCFLRILFVFSSCFVGLFIVAPCVVPLGISTVPRRAHRGLAFSLLRWLGGDTNEFAISHESQPRRCAPPLPDAPSLIRFPIVNWPASYYIAVRARLDEAGTDGFVYCFGLALDRLGGQIVSHRASAGTGR